MSSTVSCSSAAQSVAVSSRRPAQILATPSGCMMKSSPERRRWSAWCSQANTNARCTALQVDLVDGLAGVLLDNREQVAEEGPLVFGKTGPRPGRALRLRRVHRAALELALGYVRGRCARRVAGLLCLRLRLGLWLGLGHGAALRARARGALRLGTIGARLRAVRGALRAGLAAALGVWLWHLGHRFEFRGRAIPREARARARSTPA